MNISNLITFDTRRYRVPGIRSKKNKRSILDHLLASEIAQAVIPEIHLTDLADDGQIRKCSFCGPFTNIHKRLEIVNGKVRRIITPPINTLDAACMQHDIAYELSRDPAVWRDADRTLIRAADEIALNHPNPINKKTARLVSKIIRNKLATATKHNVL